MSIFDHLARHVDQHFERAADGPLALDLTPAQIRCRLAERLSFDAPRPLEEIVEEVGDLLFHGSVHASNRRHFGLFRPAIDRSAVVADALVAAYDPNLAVYEFSPTAHEIEAEVLATLTRRFGFEGPDAASHFTSGGQEANHTAVLAALSARFPQIRSRGLRALPAQPVFYASEEAHHSLEKVAQSTGLGRAAFRWIPAAADLRMDLTALAQQIRADRRAGHEPFLVVGTAGTTNAGVIDPLPELAELAQAEEIWFHVDAAWGGAAVLSDRLRPHLAGIERADSITCDAHKWLSVPTGAGMFFCRDGSVLERAFSIDAAYVPPRMEDGRIAPLNVTLQWSRRFMGLKLFFLFTELGVAGVAKRIEHQTEMGEALRARLQAAGFELLNETPLPLVCFTHPRIESGAVDRGWLARKLAAAGDGWISVTRLRRSFPALRACICHYDTRPSDLDRLVGALDAAVRSAGPHEAGRTARGLPDGVKTA